MLVDIKMDEMDGLSLIRKLREEYRAEETLFIIVTAYDEFFLCAAGDTVKCGKLSAETIGKTENGGNDTENKKAAG